MTTSTLVPEISPALTPACVGLGVNGELLPLCCHWTYWKYSVPRLTPTASIKPVFGVPLVPLTAAFADATGLVTSTGGVRHGRLREVERERRAVDNRRIFARRKDDGAAGCPRRTKPSLSEGLLSHDCTTATPAALRLIVANPILDAVSVPKSVELKSFVP